VIALARKDTKETQAKAEQNLQQTNHIETQINSNLKTTASQTASYDNCKHNNQILSIPEIQDSKVSIPPIEGLPPP